MAKKLFAMEDVESEETLQSDMDTNAIELDIAENNSELSEDSRDMESDEDVVSDGITAMEELSGIEDLIESESELTEPAVDAIKIATEAISSKLGLRTEDLIPAHALESLPVKHGDINNSNTNSSGTSLIKNDDVDRTDYSLSGKATLLDKIKETLKNIWSKIKEVLGAIIGKLINYGVKLLSSKKGFHNLYTKYEAETKEKKDTLDQHAGGTISLPTAMEGLVLNESTLTPGVWMSLIKYTNIEGYFKKTLDPISEGINKSVSDLSSKTSKLDGIDAPTLYSRIKERTKSLEDSTVYIPGDKRSDIYFPNGIKLAMSITTREDGTVKLTSGYSQLQVKGRLKDLVLASSDELLNLLKEAKDSLKVYDFLHKKIDTHSSMYRKNVSTLDKVINKLVNKGENKLDPKSYSVLKGYVTNISTMEKDITSVYRRASMCILFTHNYFSKYVKLQLA